MVRLQVTLDENEARLLVRWAALELRDPRDQIRLIVRQALQQRGLLPAETKAAQAEGESREAANEAERESGL